MAISERHVFPTAQRSDLLGRDKKVNGGCAARLTWRSEIAIHLRQQTSAPLRMTERNEADSNINPSTYPLSMNAFITGTDTGVGKTYVTARLLRENRARGLDSVGFKPDREEHTSELQSPDHLVCRLLLEKK